MPNNLLRPLNSYFKEIASLEGKLATSKVSIDVYQASLKKENFSHRPHVDSMTMYRDLSIKIGEYNLFDTGYYYTLSARNLEEELNNILSRVYCLTLSQAYEIFESFLIKILTDFLYKKQEHLVSLKFIKARLFLTKSTIKDMIKSSQKKNNRGLLSLVRKISTYYKHHETNNTWNLNIANWFDLLSEVRHNIIHNRQSISDKLLRYFETNHSRNLFEKYFKRKNIDDEIHIYLDYSQTITNIELLNQYAFLIFKSLSVDSGLDPKYYKLL